MRELILGEALDTLIDHRGKTPKKLGGDFSSAGVPVVSALLVKNGRLMLSEARYISQEIYGKWMPVGTRKNDVILTSEAPLGQCALVESDEPLALGQRVFCLRARSGLLDGRFLYYALQTNRVQAELASRSSGTTVLGIRQSELLKVRVPVPGLDEQQATVEVLGALDDKIAANERIANAVLALADCYYEMVHREVGADARSTFSQLVTGGHLEFGDGYRTKKSEHGEPGLPILRVAEVADGEIRPAFGDHVREEFRSAMGAKTSRAGDVVLTTKGTVGRAALISAGSPEFVYSPQVCYFRAANNALVSNIYLFHWMRGTDFWRQAAGMKGQTDMADYLSLSDIKSMSIPLPSEGALAEFNRKCAALHARGEAARAENRTLAELRDALLPQLVSGKLRVKDAARTVEEAV
ncbi:restriction endonuclease subunit S [Streptomyces nondiastaticus]|uniref:restriction endonuclease subunit S n=1 Tax=Streptomyces nondiastaticus TaxID=3154512 RepID=UPI0034204C31